MKVGTERISKKLWYALGGFSNNDLFRKQVNGAWCYYIDHR